MCLPLQPAATQEMTKAWRQVHIMLTHVASQSIYYDSVSCDKYLDYVANQPYCHSTLSTEYEQ